MSTITRREQSVAPSAAPEGAAAHERRPSLLWQSLRRAAPTAAVVLALAGLAAWGHSTDWTMPKFSSLMTNNVTEIDAWCHDHNVPERQCIECDPSLLPLGVDHGWCKEHGVAQCPLEHPDIAQTKSPAIVTAQMRDRAAHALAIVPRAENNSLCTLHQRRIQFASAEAIEKSGIDIAIVQQRSMVESVVANGEVIYDQTRMAHLSSRVHGAVWRVEGQVGQRVERGDVLALVDGADVGQAKSEFLQAITQLRLMRVAVDRLRPLAGNGAVPGRQFSEAEVAHQQAQIRLHAARQALVNLGLSIGADDFAGVAPEEIAERIQFLGLPADLAVRLDAQSTTSNLFPVRSPLGGVIVERNVVEGEVVDTGTMLFAVADVSRLWLMLHVRQEDANYLTLGQKVLFRSSDDPREPEIEGSLAWISTAADDQTRTVRVRVDLPNPDGRLRANTFGTGRIVLREERRAVVVPSEAVHWDGCCSVVFVRDKEYFHEGAPKFFHVRKVRLGAKDGDTTEIIAGLLPFEVIASKNSVILESQLLKSNLGAGCCEVPVPTN